MILKMLFDKAHGTTFSFFTLSQKDLYNDLCLKCPYYGFTICNNRRA